MDDEPESVIFRGSPPMPSLRLRSWERWGHAGIICAIAASLAMDLLELWIMFFCQQLWQKDFIVVDVILVAVFPALALINSLGYLAATWLWLAPLAHKLLPGSRTAFALKVISPAAVVFAAASTLFGIFQTLFPPRALGGQPLPASVSLTINAIAWLFIVLAIPYAWWFWNMVRNLMNCRSRGPAVIIAALSWAWPTLYLLKYLTPVFQDWLSPALVSLRTVSLLFRLDVLIGLSIAPVGASLLLNIASLFVICAFQGNPDKQRSGIQPA